MMVSALECRRLNLAVLRELPFPLGPHLWCFPSPCRRDIVQNCELQSYEGGILGICTRNGSVNWL